jgi:hypothetical protein
LATVESQEPLFLTLFLKISREKRGVKKHAKNREIITILLSRAKLQSVIPKNFITNKEIKQQFYAKKPNKFYFDS